MLKGRRDGLVLLWAESDELGAHVSCRHNNALAQILGRCARMQQDLASTDDDDSPDGFGDDAPEQQAVTGASTKHSGQQGFSSVRQGSRSNNSTAGQLRAQTNR
jgi:hypothetical protein